MLFHEALHHVFTTFSRQVLQQGRITAYLADCAVFDTFDDRRTICLTIDQRYGARLYACLSHSPYKPQFDAILSEVKQLHPTIDPLQVDYVFQSIRFAWGKIRSVRPPKAPNPFPIAKRPIARKASNRASARPIAKRPKARRPASTPKTLYPTPQKRPTPTPRAAAYRRLIYQQLSQRRISQMVMYFLVMIYIFAASVSYFSGHSTLALLMAAMAVLFIIIRIKWL
jgi:hypothetical protein